jgi:hypothetical protein
MSRVVWGAVSSGSIKRTKEEEEARRQPKLDGFVTKRKRERDAGDSNGDEIDDDEVKLEVPQREPTAPAGIKAEVDCSDRGGNTTRSVSGGSTARGSAAMNKALMMVMSPQAFLQHQPDDAVCWGPSGGGDRESMGRRRPRPFMNGKEMNMLFNEASPYSRPYIAAWKAQLAEAAEVRHQGGDQEAGVTRVKDESTATATRAAMEVKQEFNARSMKHERGSEGREDAEVSPSRPLIDMSTTDFDDALLKPYLKDGCPRNLFAGKVFFLNSCDVIPEISTYLLEKLIRYLGGVTSMGVGGHVHYVVTQHLSSAKELKLLGQEGRQSKKKMTATQYIHPRFILKCAEQGKLVPEKEFRTITSSSMFGPGDVSRTEVQPVSSLSHPRSIAPTASATAPNRIRVQKTLEAGSTARPNSTRAATTDDEVIVLSP